MTVSGIRISGQDINAFPLVNSKSILNEIREVSQDEEQYQIDLIDSVEEDPGDNSEDLLDEFEDSQSRKAEPKLNPSGGRKRSVGEMDKALLKTEEPIKVAKNFGRRVQIDKKTSGYANPGESDEDCIARYRLKYSKL